jgi:hypothetical protein
VSVSDYSRGLRHGRQDLAKLIADILAMDIPDAKKLEQIGWHAAAAIELGDKDGPYDPRD